MAEYMKFVESVPGEHIEETYRRAVREGVAIFVHNDAIYRLTKFEQIGTVDMGLLRTTIRRDSDA